MSLDVLFTELLGRYQDFAPAGRPERLLSTFASGYKHVPITARPRRGGRKPGGSLVGRNRGA
nr:hypothetical protein GCM10020092_037900 [Actinoplanes digitatis]